MWDSFLSLEFDRYGITLSSEPVYLFFSWGSLIVVGLAIVALKVRKNRKDRFKF